MVCRGAWTSSSVALGTGCARRAHRLAFASAARALLACPQATCVSALRPFFPPISGVLSRRPRAPTQDLPSCSCFSPCDSLRLALANMRLFSPLLWYFDAPASLNAIAMAYLRRLTLPPHPPRPILSAPCLNSCMTRPVLLRWRGEVCGIALHPNVGFASYRTRAWRRSF
jgi:hypothetical protein